MNGRFAKILLCILSGALLLLAGCTTPAPTGEAAPPPTQSMVTGQQGAATADLAGVTSLLQSIDSRLSTVVENTRPEGRGTMTGNMVLFDTQGNTGNAVTSGISLITLPPGKCDIVIFSQSVGLYVTMEEEKDIEIGKERYYRNRQTCINEPMCRRTVQLDNDFAFLYLEYRPYNSGNTLNRVTLSYRCS